MKLKSIFAVCVLSIMAAFTSRAATPSLVGETVAIKLNFSTFADTMVNVDLFTTNFTVGAGSEIVNRPISTTFTSGGFPQTLSGNVSVDVGASNVYVTFSGTQQPGSLTFTLSSINGESVGSITSATQTSATGFTSGVNQPLGVSFSNTGDGSVSCGFVPLGFQPGVSLAQAVDIGLSTVPITPPAVTVNPTNLTVSAGGTATFNSAATGSPTPTIRWQVSTNNGATFANISPVQSNNILSFAAAAGDDGKQYRARFSNSVGTTNSTAAILTVSSGVAPSITTNPTNFAVNVGGTATFTAAASGTPTPTVQWQVSANGGANYTDIIGATSATLSFAAAVGDNGKLYRAVFTNSLGSATSTGASLTVAVAFPTQFVVTAPTNATAGVPFNFIITARDNSSNTATAYTGTVNFTSTDAQAVLPANTTLTNGVGTFSATLKTAGSRTITATDTVSNSVTGSRGVSVTAAAAASFVVSAPTNATAGLAFNVTVTAKDAFNNTALGYAGTVHFTSGDAQAVLPANSTLTSGVGTFSVTLKTAGSRSITATDTVTGSITGSSNVAVSPAAAAAFAVSAPASATAGSAFNFTITAKDAFNNTATGYGGTAHFTSADAQAVLPANSTLTSGVGTFSATLKTAGSQSIAATDTVTGSLTGSTNVTVNPAAAASLVVSAPGTATAGSAFNFTVTAKDAFNNTATGYSGTAHFTSGDGQAVLPANSTLTSGVGTFSATLKTAGNQTVVATDTVSGSVTGSASVTVSAAAAAGFAVSAPASATAGIAFNFTVTAKDAFNNTATSYSGTAHFTSGDAQAVLPANATLTSGVGTFSATLKTAGSETVVATDTVSSSVTGGANVTVNPAAAVSLSLSAPASATAGASFNITVTAKDAFNNTATGYGGTVHFTSGDGQAVLPADSTLTSGVGIFSTTLKTVGNFNVTATDTVTGSISGSASVTVNPAAAVSFVVSAPASSTAGSAFNVTVTAKDLYNNTATGYSGTVHFTSGDAQAVLPANSTLTSGVGTFSVTLKTAGSQAVTATDTVSSSVTGNAGVTVSPAAAVGFAVSAPANATAGTSFNFTVAAKDAYNNVATGYSGTAHFTSADAQAVLPANTTLTSGVGTFSATLKTAGSQTVVATDTVSSSITGNASVTVNPAAAASLVLSAPGTATAGSSFNVTVTAKDAYNNIATGYGGTAHFTSSDAQAVLPADSTLTSGTGIFSVTLKTSGNQTFTVTDTVTGSLTANANVAVSPAAVASLAVSAPASATAGVAVNFTVTAKDAFNNTVPSYSGTVHFTSGDAQAVLPADATLTAGSGTFSATLKTAGSRSLTAGDTVAGSIVGSANVTVNPAAATSFVLGTPGSATAGVSFNVTVTAKDGFNNTATGYGGTVHFTSSDAQAVLPADASLTSGVGTFSVTLKTAGGQTVIATDTVSSSIAGGVGLVVDPAAAASFAVSAPANAVAGVAFNFTVTAKDAFNNTATGYAGTAHFTSGDAQAVLPANATLTSGAGTFSATLKTAGSQTVTATDTVSSSINGGATVVVSPAAAASFVVTMPGTSVAGTSLSVTITAKDAFNNTATGYGGTIHFTSGDAQGVLPADSTLASGVGTFNVTLKTAGSYGVNVADTVSASIFGNAPIVVTPAAASVFVIGAPATVKARIASNFSVTAKDAYGNVATGYGGIVHFSSTDGAATLPANSTLASGLGTFSVTMQTAGLQAITATDTVNSSVTGTSSAIEVLDLQIVVQPADQNVLVASNATFSVGVSGTAPFAYQWFTNGVVANAATNASFTISNVSLTSPTNYFVIISNAWGSVTSSVAKLIPSGVFTYPSLQAHTAVLNPLTGLYEERITVTNFAGPISGVRLLVGGLPSNVSLYNAAGTNNGLPYSQFNATMATGATNMFLLQFYNPTRRIFTNTVEVVALNAGLTQQPGTTNTAAGIPITEVKMDTSIPGSPRFTLAFTSVVGAHYQVLYSDDSLATWHLASTVTAVANWTIWTEVLPPAPGSRMFKVILLP